MGVIRFNGISSADFGCTIERRPNHTRGSRRGELIEVPGRNGAAVLEDGSFTTYTQEYVMAFKEGDTVPPYKRAAQVAEWLLGSRGFCRLEDDFEPNVYRMARYAGALNIEQVADEYGRVVLEFECQPQRYFLFGECDISISNYNNSATVVVRNIPETVESVKVRAAGTIEFFMRNATNRIDAEMEQQGDYEVGVLQTAGGYNRAYVNASLVADNFAEMRFIDADDEEVVVFSINADGVQFVNPTQNAACPVMEFRDLTNEPTPVAQTLSIIEDAYIGNDGDAYPVQFGQEGDGYDICDEVSVTGYAYAYITGNSYAFYDSSHNPISFVHDYYNSKRVYMDNTQVIIPSGASVVVIGTKPGAPSMALSLKAARQNPGTAAVVIGTTTINLDFSEHDTIILDCDLHDAHYTDGSSANSKVTFSDPFNSYPTFPTLGSGATMVKPGDGTNLGFSIQTRWWSL